MGSSDVVDHLTCNYGFFITYIHSLFFNFKWIDNNKKHQTTIPSRFVHKQSLK